MDITDINDNNFETVWARVTGSPNSISPAHGSDDKQLLEKLITGEATNRAFYKSAAVQCVKCTQLFNKLAEISSARLGKLQVMYFLLTGNTMCPPTSTPFSSPSALSALRSAYWRESETAAALIAAASSICSGKFSAYAAEFARQAAGSAELIMQFIYRIVN